MTTQAEARLIHRPRAAPEISWEPPLQQQRRITPRHRRRRCASVHGRLHAEARARWSWPDAFARGLEARLPAKRRASRGAPIPPRPALSADATRSRFGCDVLLSSLDLDGALGTRSPAPLGLVQGPTQGAGSCLRWCFSLVCVAMVAGMHAQTCTHVVVRCYAQVRPLLDLCADRQAASHVIAHVGPRAACSHVDTTA